jgi:hypothetical protein
MERKSPKIFFEPCISSLTRSNNNFDERDFAGDGREIASVERKQKTSSKVRLNAFDHINDRIRVDVDLAPTQTYHSSRSSEM